MNKRYEMSVIALLSLLALSFANPVPQVVSDDASVITEVNSAVRQFLQTSRPRDQADADGQAHFFAEQTARLETTATFKQRTDNSHGWDCSPWRTNPLPSFVWCMEAGNDLGYMPWPKGTVFGQKDPITKACAPGVVACMPMVFGEGDCQMVLDFYPEEEKTDTAWIGNINDVVLWEMLKCQAWR